MPNPAGELSVLLVDADQVDRMLACRALRHMVEASILVREVCSYDQAVAALQERSFDCVILDHHLPGGSAFELLAELKILHLELPVIVLTSTTDPVTAVRLIRAGAADFHLKNRLEDGILGQQVLRAVRVHCAERQARITGQAYQSQLTLTKAITDNTTEAMFLTDEDGCITFANPAAERMFGWSRTEMLGRHLHNLIHNHRPDGRDYPACDCPLDHVLASGKPLHDHEDVFFRRDGTPVNVLCSNSPILHLGRATGAVLVAHDITERKKIYDALHDSEKCLKLALQSGRLGMWELCLNTWALQASAQCKHNMGLAADAELNYDMMSELIHPEDRPRVAALVRVAIETGGEYYAEYRIHASAEFQRWVSARGQVFRDKDGAPLRMVGTTLDITERKRSEYDALRMNAELQLARDEALAASRAKSAFLANMSHELRTPLNAIIGYAEMIEEEASQAAQEVILEDSRRIRSAGLHLLAIISDVLDLSRIEAGRLQLYVETFDVAEVVRDAVAMVAPVIERNCNTVSVLLPDTPVIMNSDRTRFRQVLFNLMGNAAKFTQNGIITIGCTADIINCSDTVELYVQDTGIGMTSEQLKKVFEKFHQVDSSYTRRQTGSGLGLSICRLLCDMMGGSIAAESRPGEGTTFTVRLPLYAGAERPALRA